MEPLKKILLCLRNVFTKKDDSVIPTDFSDLAPLDSIDNTSEYLNALDWALKNRRIRNVALCGPYGAGKSSIINSYLKSHADAQQKSLRISMATFIESKTEGSDSSHSVALKPDEIETGILKQLFYKVPHTKIPQSRYRKLHKGGKLVAWRNLVLISIFLLLLGFIFAPDHVINVTNILYETWPFSTPPAKVAIVAFAILFTGVLGSIAWCFYPAFSRMKISSISISAKANVEGDEESKESIFNKNILIDYRHIPFTPNQMKELKKQYPSLQAKFILQNQADAFAELDSVPMDQNLFQELLLDPRLESQYRQTLFDSYYQMYLNTQIADKVDELGLSVNHDEFEEVWQLLSDGERENFLLSHLEILNRDDFEKCFANMEPPFNLLSNRTQRNQVTVPWKDGIKQLLDRLKAVKYITSYTEKAAAQQNDGSRQDEKSNSSVYIVRIKVLK